MIRFTAPLLAVCAFSVNAGAATIIQFTDQATFESLLTPTVFRNDFASLTPGPQGANSVSSSGGSPFVSLVISSLTSTGTATGGNLWLAASASVPRGLGTLTASDQLQLQAGFSAIGGNWFLSDVNDAFVAGTVQLTFNDGTMFSIASTTLAESWRGFVSDTPLASVRVTPVTANLFVTVDNLAVVPEPASASLALAAAGFFLRRRRA